MKNLIFSILLIMSSSICSADDESVTIDRDIANTQTVDELIVKMNKADEKYRYKYMNAIKSKIIALKEDMRKKAMDEIIEKIDGADSDSQRQGKEGFGGSFKDGVEAGMQQGMESADRDTGEMGGIGGEGRGGMGGTGGNSGGGHGGGGFH